MPTTMQIDVGCFLNNESAAVALCQEQNNMVGSATRIMHMHNVDRTAIYQVNVPKQLTKWSPIHLKDLLFIVLQTASGTTDGSNGSFHGSAIQPSTDPENKLKRLTASDMWILDLVANGSFHHLERHDYILCVFGTILKWIVYSKKINFLTLTLPRCYSTIESKKNE